MKASSHSHIITLHKTSNLLRLLHCLLFSLISREITAQTWRTWIDPLYKIHTLLNDSQYVKSKNTLQLKKNKLDTLHPIWHHSISRIALHEKRTKEAITHSRSALSQVYKWKNDTEKYTRLKKIYFLDEQYLTLYYRFILTNFMDQNRSNSSKSKNQELLKYTYEQQVFLAHEIPQENVLIKLTLPRLIYHLNATNDSIDFKEAMRHKSVPVLKAYYQKLDKRLTKTEKIPKHLSTFHNEARDSIYSWEYEIVCQTPSESAFLNYVRKYPHSPYKNNARNFADQLAFRTCRISNLEKDYREYLSRYPNGKYRNQANKLLRYLTVVPVPYLTKNGKYRFVDSSNLRSWIDSSFDFAYPFKLKYHNQWVSNASCLINGCALVMQVDSFQRHQWFYIEKDGKPYNNKYYDEIRQISFNRAIVSRNSHIGLIDQHGRELLPPVFERLYYDTLNRIGIIYNGSKWALFNHNGKRLTEFLFDDILLEEEIRNVPFETTRFTDNRVIGTKKSRLWVVNYSGEPVFIGNYQSISPFFRGLSIAKTMNIDGYTIIDTTGKVVSDTFRHLERVDKVNIYITRHKAHFTVIHYQDTTAVWTLESDKKPLIARYWGMPLVATYSKQSWQIFALDSINPLSAIKDDLQIKGDQIFVTIKKIKRGRKRMDKIAWFNPKSKKLSSILSDNIAVLDHSRLVSFTGNTPVIFNVFEKEFPIFSLRDSPHPIPKWNEIRKSGYPEYYFAYGDSVQCVIDTVGRVIFTEVNCNLEFVDNKLIVCYYTNGKSKLVDLKNQTILSDFNDLIHPSFPGYYLINIKDKWSWVDQRKRLLGEPI